MNCQTQGEKKHMKRKPPLVSAFLFCLSLAAAGYSVKEPCLFLFPWDKPRRPNAFRHVCPANVPASHRRPHACTSAYPGVRAPVFEGKGGFATPILNAPGHARRIPHSLPGKWLV